MRGVAVKRPCSGRIEHGVARLHIGVALARSRLRRNMPAHRGEVYRRHTSSSLPPFRYPSGARFLRWSAALACAAVSGELGKHRRRHSHHYCRSRRRICHHHRYLPLVTRLVLASCVGPRRSLVRPCRTNSGSIVVVVIVIIIVVVDVESAIIIATSLSSPVWCSLLALVRGARLCSRVGRTQEAPSSSP